MHQFQKLGLGSRHAQLLNDPKADARTAMHGHAGRLVNHQQAVILQQHHKLARRCAPRHGVGHGLGLFNHPIRNTNRWQPHRVAGFNPGIGGRPPFVNAHLTTANDAVNMGLGHALEVAHQEVVEPLPRRVFIDEERFNLGDLWGRIAPYNLFH